MGWMRARFLLGVSVFVVPAFLCLRAYLTAPHAGYQVDNVYAQVKMTEVGDKVSQTFCSQGSSISKIRFVTGVNNRINQGCVKLTVRDSEDTILFEDDWQVSGWLEDRIVTADLDGVAVQEGGYYTAEFEVTQTVGDFAVSIYSSQEMVTGDEKEVACENGEEQAYQLRMTVYQ